MCILLYNFGFICRRETPWELNYFDIILLTLQIKIKLEDIISSNMSNPKQKTNIQYNMCKSFNVLLLTAVLILIRYKIPWVKMAIIRYWTRSANNMQKIASLIYYMYMQIASHIYTYKEITFKVLNIIYYYYVIHL